MNIRGFLTLRHILFAGVFIAAIVALSTINFESAFANHATRSIKMGGQDACTTQVVGLLPGNPPVTFTINYQNGPIFNRTVSYATDTAPCPPGITGTIEPNPAGSGNIQSITYQGVVIPYNGPVQSFPTPGGIVRVHAYSYSGNVYAEFKFPSCP